MKHFLLTLLAVLLLPIAVHAATVEDLYKGDAMTVDEVITFPEVPPGLTIVNETIGESTIIPYDSHDGYAIVNKDEQFFDKVITLTADDFVAGNTTIEFNVANQSGRVWSDFHFEFYYVDPGNLDFLGPLQLEILNAWSNPFDQGGITASEVVSSINFYSETAVVENLEAALFSITFGIPGNNGADLGVDCLPPLDFVFGVRQIATTTPIPGAFFLMASGLLGLAGFTRKNIRA